MMWILLILMTDGIVAFLSAEVCLTSADYRFKRSAELSKGAIV